ncbi:MAG: histidine phosphatase family protein [Vicinamibacterales bacterium]
MPNQRSLLCALAISLTLGASAAAQSVPASGRLSAAPGPSGQTLRIYLARHGETLYNAERRVQGQLDIPLNRRGLEQAAQLRDDLRGVAFDAIYASPMDRNITTASIIGNGQPVRVLPDLIERNQGRFQGMLADSAADFARRMTDPRDDLDGGETTFALAARAQRALTTIRRIHKSGAVLVVGHFLTNQMLVKELLGMTVERAMQVNQANDELYLIEINPQRRARSWKLITPGKLGEL